MTRREKAAVRAVVLETLLEVGQQIDEDEKSTRGACRPGETLTRMLADARKQAV